jgi:hypothetical protein
MPEMFPIKNLTTFIGVWSVEVFWAHPIPLNDYLADLSGL